MLDELDYEIKNASIWPTGLQYGAYGGLGLIVISLFSHLMGWTATDTSFSLINILSSLITYAIIFGSILLGVKYLKESLQDGYVDFGKAFKLGLVVSLVMAVLIGIWMFVFLEYIDPNFLQNMVDMLEFQYEEQGLSDDEIERLMGFMETYMFNPAAFSISIVLVQFFTGLVFSLIVAAILQKQRLSK